MEEPIVETLFARIYFLNAVVSCVRDIKRIEVATGIQWKLKLPKSGSGHAEGIFHGQCVGIVVPKANNSVIC